MGCHRAPGLPPVGFSYLTHCLYGVIQVALFYRRMHQQHESLLTYPHGNGP